MKRKQLLLMMMLCCWPWMAHAGDRPAAQQAMAFLELPMGPRPVAMGEAFTGLADDVSTLSWNPAGLGLLSGAEVAFMHNQWLVNLRQEFLTACYPLWNGMLGFQATYLNSDIQLRRDEDGLLVGQGFRPYSLMTGLAFAYPLQPGLALGAGLSLAREQLDDVTYSTGYADLGVLYKPEDTWWSLGASLLHAGLPVAGYPLPLTARVGGALHFFQDSFNITADISRTLPGWFTYSLGVEYWYHNLFALRAGYTWHPENEGLDQLSGLRAGLGFNIQGYQLDYALIPQGDLGYGHRAILTMFFGGGRALANEKKDLIIKARKKGQRGLADKAYAQAIDAFQKVLTFMPTDPVASSGVKEATRGLRQQEQQQEVAHRLKKAARFAKQHQYQDAIEEYQRILLIDENNSKAVKGLATVRGTFNRQTIAKELAVARKAYKEMRWADALLACQAVLTIDKDHKEAKKMLKKTRAQMTKTSKSFKDPRIREYYLAGLKAFERGAYREAIKQWDRVLKIAPHHQQTRKILKQALNLLEAKVNELLKAAGDYLAGGDLIRAAGHLHQVLALSPRHPQALSMLHKQEKTFNAKAKELYIKGIGQYTQAEYKQAIANWQDVLTLDPTYPGAKDNIKKAKEKIKTLQKWG